jgi:predicted nucleic acid-binding protein
VAALVLDSSVTVAWLIRDEDTVAVRRVLDLVTRHGAVVPSLWRLEVANTLLVAVRRGRLTTAQRTRALHGLAGLPIEIDPQTGDHAWSATLDLAEQHGLSVYDAAYLELASRRSLPLVTFDRELAAAAEAHGVPRLPDEDGG